MLCCVPRRHRGTKKPECLDVWWKSAVCVEGSQRHTWPFRRSGTVRSCRAQFALVCSKLAESSAILAGFDKTSWKYMGKYTYRKKNHQGTQDFTKWNISIPCKFYKIGNHFKISNCLSSVVKPCTKAKCKMLWLIWFSFGRHFKKIN